MGFLCSVLKFAALLLVVLVSMRANAQAPNSSRSLDAVLQDYAYRAFVRPRTGVIYDASVPETIYGVKLSVVRLRSGSLRARGVQFYEFQFPPGVRGWPYVERLALVYQNLVNWSSFYYHVPGHTLVSPVLGILAYEASNLTATNLPELNVAATMRPISVNFSSTTIPSGLTAKCVRFDLNGSLEYSNLSAPNTCSTLKQGHFSLVVESIAPVSAPSPAPSEVPPSPPPNQVPAPGGVESQGKSSSKLWKVTVGSVVGGFVVVAGLAICAIALLRLKRKSQLAAMEQQADQGEALRVSEIGSTKAPAAIGTRTQPILETEYVA
ncbi:uncharacterized protein LOC116261770 [Nymphaea colorata]|uniref:uncharacterized protein LOC116261770 n=1 Tax=Nymphaea colorata TaxID=210225 RepID=UPI00129EE292|nr:uncharacterized protein LOC116261770 [Nymphaea colorata]